MKKVRIVDEKLMDAVRNLPCLGCASIDPQGAREAIFENEIRSHPHHVITRAHGGCDVAENLMPLCWKHHREVHSTGLARFSQEYRVVHDWLEFGGWAFNGVTWEEPISVYGREEVCPSV